MRRDEKIEGDRLWEDLISPSNEVLKDFFKIGYYRLNWRFLKGDNEKKNK